MLWLLTLHTNKDAAVVVALWVTDVPLEPSMIDEDIYRKAPKTLQV